MMLNSTYFAYAIDKTILFSKVHGLGLPQAAGPLNPDASCVHLTAGLLNLSNTVAHVAPQGDVRRPGSLGATSRHVVSCTVYPD